MARDVEVEFEDSAAYRRVKALLEGSEEWSIECATPYSEFVEFGAGPAAGHGQFKPPEKPIREWAHLKLGLNGKKLDQAVEAIRWSIYQSGLRAQPFARPAIHDLMNDIGTVVDEALASGEDPMNAVVKHIRTRMRVHIMQNGTGNEGTLASEMYIVHPDGGREK